MYESPLGPLTMTSGTGGLRHVYFPGQAKGLAEADRRPLAPLRAQLDEYFAGRRQAFEIDLDLSGNPLQLQVWERLLEIPYGETVSYGELAERVDPDAFPASLESWERARAVGAAVGRTPTPIVVPCHRVIGADGSLTGYGGGLERKRTLLELERGVLGAPETAPAWQERQEAMF